MVADLDAEQKLSEWVRCARGGDVSAFGSLVEATEQMVRGVVRRFLGDSPDALDAAQDAYLSAFKRLGELREEFAFRGWLRRIAVARANDIRRRRGTFL